MQEQEADDEINLIPYLKTAWNGVLHIKWFLIVFVALSMVITSVISSRMTKYYQAEVTFISSGSDAGGLGGALAGLLGGGGGGSSPDNLMVFLKSRSTAEDVVNKLNLMKFIYKSDWDETKGTWKNPNNLPQLVYAAKILTNNMIACKKSKDGAYVLTVECQDPIIAADIANYYIVALTNSLNAYAVNTTIRVIDKALPDANPFKPNVNKNVKVAGVISLLAGILAGYVIENRREKNSA